MTAAATLARPSLADLLAFGNPDSDSPELYWPVWKFGQIIKPRGADGLSVREAQDIGRLFEEGSEFAGRAARRYRSEHMLQVRDAIARRGGQSHFAGQQFDTLHEALPEPLRRRGHAPLIRVSYQFVPIIRFPRFFVDLGERTWLVREGMTICGSPAKSKTWIAISLVSDRGRSLDRSPISLRDLTEIRGQLTGLRGELSSLLLRFYRKVLAEDALKENIGISPIEDLVPHRTVEIVGVIADNVRSTIEDIDRLGLFAALERPTVPACPLFFDFLSWCERLQPESVSTPSLPQIDPSSDPKYKLVDIYPAEAQFDPVRTFVVPKTFQTGSVEAVWYGLLAPKDDRPGRALVTELATSYLAEEIGRSH